MGTRARLTIAAAILVVCAVAVPHAQTPDATESPDYPVYTPPGIDGQVVRRVFEDSGGNLWFGGDGVYRYDGKSLECFILEGPIGGVTAREFKEDRAGNIWLATSGGVFKYDGKTFSNLHEKHGLVHNDVWALEVDRTGVVWLGTWRGVCYFDGETFTPFEIPEAEPDPTRGVTSARIVHSIIEDSIGQIWFGTNGGAYVWDGDALTNISEKDGLCHDSVNCILEDRDGNMWFATHHNGVCRYDGETFTQMSEGEAWDLYEDSAGNIWFPEENVGLYRYDGKNYTSFNKNNGLDLDAIHDTFEDKDGRIWVSGYLGIFRLEGNAFVAVTKDGPWQ